MKQWLLITGWTLVLVPCVQASALRITSFDRAGRLTFQEVPAAVSYRVEWTTNLASPAWSSNVPGIAAIPPSGGNTLTVTVGVVHASCYYRVVAELTNVPPVGLANTFDHTSEGWVVVNYPFRSHNPNPGTAPLAFDETFGNPPGSVLVGDVYAETGIAAPAQYLGNKLAYYGGRLAYDIYVRYTDNVTYPAVIMNGGTLSLYYDAPSPALRTWERRTIPLSETGWRVSGSHEPATDAVFKSVLSNLVGLYIYTEWHTGEDSTSVDNITMTPP